MSSRRRPSTLHPSSVHFVWSHARLLYTLAKLMAFACRPMRQN